MQAFGAPQHVIDAELGKHAGDDGLYGLWPMHWKPLRAFILASTQWRVTATFASLIHNGLDYASAAIAWTHHGIALDAQGFADLQTLEHHARQLLNGKKPQELKPA